MSFQLIQVFFFFFFVGDLNGCLQEGAKNLEIQASKRLRDRSWSWHSSPLNKIETKLIKSKSWRLWLNDMIGDIIELQRSTRKFDRSNEALPYATYRHLFLSAPPGAKGVGHCPMTGRHFQPWMVDFKFSFILQPVRAFWFLFSKRIPSWFNLNSASHK